MYLIQEFSSNTYFLLISSILISGQSLRGRKKRIAFFKTSVQKRIEISDKTFQKVKFAYTNFGVANNLPISVSKI